MLHCPDRVFGNHYIHNDIYIYINQYAYLSWFPISRRRTGCIGKVRVGLGAGVAASNML
jgi:hypothetical protein